MYPTVIDESSTLSAVLRGNSLARFGDGEFNLCAGHGIPCQRFVPALADRLRAILHDSGACLVGIPNLRSETPKRAFWQRYETIAPPFLRTGRAYVSAFVTRPDSAPWIDTTTFWADLERLWVDQDVTLVRGSTRSLIAEDLAGARVTEIVAPRAHAWDSYADLLERIGAPSRVLLCLGPTATVLAVDLAARGVHAVDLGHVGMFLRKHRQGDPMIVTDKDRAA